MPLGRADWRTPDLVKSESKSESIVKPEAGLGFLESSNFPFRYLAAFFGFIVCLVFGLAATPSAQGFLLALECSGITPGRLGESSTGAGY